MIGSVGGGGVAAAICTATTGIGRGGAEVTKPMPSAYFVVRATVADPSKRMAFDEWDHREHLPDAAKAFGVKKARRVWSRDDRSLPQARHELAACGAHARAQTRRSVESVSR